jgi:hypothetical protein
LLAKAGFSVKPDGPMHAPIPEAFRDPNEYETDPAFDFTQPGTGKPIPKPYANAIKPKRKHS